MFRRAPEKATAAEDRPGFLSRLRKRLNRGNSWLSYDIADLLRGRQIDAAILDELETRLISADVGVEASERILAELRKRVARNELPDVGALIAALRGSIVEILAPCARPLTIDPAHKPFVILVVGVNGSGKTTTIGKLARRYGAQGQRCCSPPATPFAPRPSSSSRCGRSAPAPISPRRRPAPTRARSCSTRCRRRGRAAPTW